MHGYSESMEPVREWLSDCIFAAAVWQCRMVRVGHDALTGQLHGIVPNECSPVQGNVVLTHAHRPCAHISGGKLRPSTGAGHDPSDDAEGLLAKRMARADPRDAAVVCHELCCLSTTVFLVSLSPIEMHFR
jgi:hypothetical protein